LLKVLNDSDSEERIINLACFSFLTIINAMTEVSKAFIEKARSLLSEYLSKVELCLEQITDEQVWQRTNESSNSIANLMLHLCGNARQWIVSGVGQTEDIRTRQTEFDAREGLTRDELLGKMRQTLKDVDDVLARLDENDLLSRRIIQGCDVTALEAVFHVTEHFSMHTGQIILLTKMLANKDMRFYEFPEGKAKSNW
jgi:uncharacterized damage-inducible protein DinB